MVCPARSAQSNPAAQVPGAPMVQGARQTPLKQRNPLWQMASVPVAEHGSFTAEISERLHAQMPEPPWARHAAQAPGLAGLQLGRHSPPMHGVPVVHGTAALQASHRAAPATGKHTNSAPPSSWRHAAGKPPMGTQVVAVHPEQLAAPLQQARQRAKFGLTASSVQRLHGWQKFETSQRSPGPPVGRQVPPWHA